MTSETTSDVAIIGAGLSGLVLALTLRQQNPTLRISIFESRADPHENPYSGGAIMLSPNSLRIFDKLGAYTALEATGASFEEMEFLTHDLKVTDTYYFGSRQLFGYPAVRVFRQDILLELLRLIGPAPASTTHSPSEVSESNGNVGITLAYAHKFLGITSSTASTTTITLQHTTADATPLPLTHTTSILIAADGVHSSVRRTLFPSIRPIYSGSVGITCAAPRSAVTFPLSVSEEQSKKPWTISAAPDSNAGAFVMSPQTADGREIFFGRQFRVAERDRKGWDEMLSDKEGLINLLRSNIDAFPAICAEIVQTAERAKLNTWPYYSVPKLKSWRSENGRVVLVGDAAHAIPPTAAQGANQGVEDAWSLGLGVGRTVRGGKEEMLDEALRHWEGYRKERVEKVLNLTVRMNSMRLPLGERDQLPEGMRWESRGGKGEELMWLYGVDYEEALVKDIRSK